MSAKIIWMSDLHFTADGDVLGHDPRVRLMRAVLYQAPAPVPAWNWNSFAPVHEDPQIGGLACEEEDLQIQ